MTQEEMNKLQEGSVVRNIKSGRLRVIRSVSRLSERSARGKRLLTAGDVHAVSFAILRCSWTKWSITTYCSTELKRQYEYVGMRAKLETTLDKALQREANLPDFRNRELTCCALRQFNYV